MAKLLIAEDDRCLAFTYREDYSQNGYEVTTVYDGTSAIEAIRNQTFDLILTDFLMPGANGKEVAEAAKEKGIPVIIHSCTPEMVGQANGTKVMSKFSPELIKEEVCLLLKGK